MLRRVEHKQKKERNPATMKHVISSSIERLVSFALFTLGIAAVTVAAAALLLIIGDTLGHG
jgi:hypothetical protein